MILQKHVLSFKCNDFFKMANLKAISSSATLNERLCDKFRTPLSKHYALMKYLSVDKAEKLFIKVLSFRVHTRLHIIHIIFVL